VKCKVHSQCPTPVAATVILIPSVFRVATLCQTPLQTCKRVEESRRDALREHEQDPSGRQFMRGRARKLKPKLE
jgi:hypothetical protein